MPSDSPIRDLLDGVAPEQMFLVFEEVLQGLEDQGQLASAARSVWLATVLAFQARVPLTLPHRVE